MTDQPAPDRRHAIAFNALGSALNTSGHWLPFTARQTAVDAVLEAIDADARDAARQTTGQTAVWPLATPCDYCSHTLNWHVTGGRCRVTAGEASCGCSAFVAPDGSHPDPAVVDEFIRDMATQHPACACTHPQERHLSACTECPCIGYAPTWPPTKRRIVPVCDQCGAPWDTGHTCATAPAVGQPAEAQATDRAKLRERIASLFRSPAGAERLGDATPGEIADAVLSVLTVEDER